jgi:ATP-dependent helicase/nuclease subunit A
VLEDLGLPANYELLEDDSEAIALVWRRFHAAVAADAAARLDFEASVAAHGRFQTQKALLAALAKRVEFALADRIGVVEASVKPMGEQFPEFAGLAEPGAVLGATGFKQQLAAAARALGRSSAATYSDCGVQLEAALRAQDVHESLDALLTKKGDPRKFNDKMDGIADIRAAQELALRLADACSQHEAWLHHHRMTRLARVLLAQFAALKRERGWVDMNDVERAALVMLSDPVLSGWVQERLDAHIRHLLIDEFQDTNPLQWQALHAWLSAYAGAGGDGPAVFIVGDPKQSIYRFRRAEPQVFRAAKEFIAQALDGDQLSCDHTHRNAPEILAVVNKVMSQAQTDSQYAGFRAHTTESQGVGLVANLPQIEREQVGASTRQAASRDPLEWRDSLTEPRELPEEKLVTLECRQAARWIAQQIDSGVRPQDIMVLARKRDRLAMMEDELRALHVPAQQPEKTDLCDAPEVQDIVALLDALVSPTHDLSLARALKSPIFALGDDALVTLALAARTSREAGRPASWFELLATLADEPFNAIAGQLARWQAWLQRLPPHDALDAIFHEADVIARFVAAAPAPFRDTVQSRLRALLGAALQVDGGRYATPYAFVRALKAGGVQAPAMPQTQAVRLLTVHGAKGLEAPIVLMLDTDAAPLRAETMGVVIEWPGEAPAPWRFAFIASESRPPPCSVEALQVELAERKREELNALYVAMTRARTQLVISSVEPHIAADASWWLRLQPYCEPIDPSGEPMLRDAKEEARIVLRELPRRQPRQFREGGHPDLPDAVVRDTEQTRFGKAIHRLLEHSKGSSSAFDATQVQRVAREFALPDATAREAAAMAQRILQGEGAWAWDAAVIDWQGNEVPLHHEGVALRIDRLVRRSGSGEWWVLDYKSLSKPQQDAELIAQMRQYRAAVLAANPGAAVRTAFLTGQGKLVVVE